MKERRTGGPNHTFASASGGLSRSMEAPLRIIAHNGAPEWGGAEIALADLLAGLTKRGHDVTLLCNRTLVAEGAASRGVETRMLRLGGDVALHNSLALARVLKRERPDAFVVGTYRKLWLAALGARIARVPNVVARIGLSSDTPRSPKYRMVLRRWVDNVVFVADTMRQSYVESLPELESRFTRFTRDCLPSADAFRPRRRDGPSAFHTT